MTPGKSGSLGASRSAQIREQLNHPVIDADGHSTPFAPLFEEYVREFGGAKAVDRYRTRTQWQLADPMTRIRSRLVKGCWGFPTTNTVDYLTGMLPALLEERLSEMGLDFSVIYTTNQRVGSPDSRDSDLRQAMCRAMNTYQSDIFRPHARHLTPAAVIPMNTPLGAIEELDYAVRTLKMKALQMSSYARREPTDAGSGPGWWDNLALDSEYDYDSVWAKCQELGVSPGFHSGTMGMGSRVSYSNSVFNHIGHFAAGCEPICKALVLGGVTNRFPDLSFLFLESGMGWASSLFADLVSHWKKRNPTALKELDPNNLDFELARNLVLQYGSEKMIDRLDNIRLIRERANWIVEEEFPDDFDEFVLSGISTQDDIVARFVPHFFFGCEGDDPLNPLAFAKGLLPSDAQLRPVYGSDIGHWDVPNVREALEEAYEHVEEGKITADNFRSFVFSNAVEFYTRANPDFFLGTAVADAVQAEKARF